MAKFICVLLGMKLPYLELVTVHTILVTFPQQSITWPEFYWTRQFTRQLSLSLSLFINHTSPKLTSFLLSALWQLRVLFLSTNHFFYNNHVQSEMKFWVWHTPAYFTLILSHGLFPRPAVSWAFLFEHLYLHEMGIKRHISIIILINKIEVMCRRNTCYI